jgi:two-component system, OmpR family, sensor histidine kinase CreC
MGYFLIVGLAGAFVLKIVVDEIKPSVRETIEEVMVDTAYLLAELAGPDLQKASFKDSSFAAAVSSYSKRDIQAKIWHFDKETLDFDVHVTDDKGIVVFDSTGNGLGKDFSKWRNIALTLKGKYGARSTRTNYGDDTSAIFHVSAPIMAGTTKETEKLIGTLTVSKPIDTVQPIIDRAQNSIVKQGIALVILAFALGLLLTYWLNRSVQRLVSFAQVASKGETGPIPDLGSKELTTLASAMGQMRDELQGKRYIEQYAQALAHELKSPLSAIAASAEFLSDPQLTQEQRTKFAQLLNDQTSRMRQSIDSMLTAARMEKTNLIDKPLSIQLNSLLQDCVNDYAALSAAKNIAMQVHIPAEPIEVTGDAVMLKLAFSNLLSNAINFSSLGQSIDVRLTKQATNCCVTIQDQGTGIPNFAQAHIGEQFYSLAQPDGQKGSGLGLRIATQIVKLHGGSLSVKNATSIETLVETLVKTSVATSIESPENQYDGCIATVTF